jgi:SAM-dependent methyltransferase
MFSVWADLLIIVVSILIMLQLSSKYNNYFFYEGMQNNEEEQNETFEYKTGDSIYDDFYTDIYDELVLNTNKNDYEVQSICDTTDVNEKSLVLDVGCGKGHHAYELAQTAKHVTGIDTSQHMIRKCQKQYSSQKNLRFIKGNVLNSVLFQPNSFSHIVCLYFTIYYIKDKSTFFRNCHNWLHHQNQKGYLVVHIVNRENFDPVVPPSSPFYFVNPQTYAKKRITSSSVTFDKFKYSADFQYEPASNQSVYIEKFHNLNNGKVFRKNEHIFYMESEEDIINIAKSEGFIVQAKIDLLKASYEYQYLYVFVTTL